MRRVNWNKIIFSPLPDNDDNHCITYDVYAVQSSYTKALIGQQLATYKKELKEKFGLVNLSVEHDELARGLTLTVESKDSLNPNFPDELRKYLINLTAKKPPSKNTKPYMNATLEFCGRDKTSIGINLVPNNKRAREELNTLLYSFKDHNRSEINLIIYKDQVNLIFDNRSLPKDITPDSLLQFVNERVIPWIDSKLNSKRMLGASSWSKKEWEVISQFQIVPPDSNEQQNFASVVVPQTDLATPQTSYPNKKQKLEDSTVKNSRFWEERRKEMNTEANKDGEVAVKNIIDLTL